MGKKATYFGLLGDLLFLGFLAFAWEGGLLANEEKGRGPQPVTLEGRFLKEDHLLFRWFAQALTGNPDLNSLRYETRRRRTLLPTLSALPNPMLRVSWENVSLHRFTVGKEEMSRIGIMALQPIPLGGKLSLARALEELEVKVAKGLYEQKRGELFYDLARLYGKFHRVQGKLELAHELVQLMKILSASRREEYSRGDKTRLDLAAIELMSERMRAEYKELKSIERELLYELTTLLGDTPELPSQIPPPPELFLPSPTPPLEETPVLLVANLMVEKAHLEKQNAELALVPHLALGAGIMYREKAFPPMGTMELSTELPLYFFRKELPLIEASVIQVRIAEERRLKVLLETQEILNRTQRRLEFLKEILPHYEEKVNFYSSLLREGLKKEYSLGGGDLTQLSEGIWRLYEAQDLLLSFQAERLRLQAQIIALFPSLIPSSKEVLDD